MKYFVFTSKHHDGFAMFDSKVSDYNIIKKTNNGYQYSINLEGDRGIYWFTDKEVFPYV